MPCTFQRVILVSARAQVWHRVSKEELQPDDPFELHQLLFRATYHAWQPAQQVGPVSVGANSCRPAMLLPPGWLMAVLPWLFACVNTRSCLHRIHRCTVAVQ